MTDINSAFRCNTRQAREFIIDCIEADVMPFLQSSPGMGKSSIIRSIANEANLRTIDHRLSTSAPEDLSGLPEFYTDDDGNRRSRFVPFDTFPIEGTRVPEGRNGWMLFFDEFNSATKSVQAAAYKIVLDKMVNQTPLHDRVFMVAAGNLATDRAIVNSLSTAMQSRVVHLEMELIFEHWFEDVALAEDWDHRIRAFLSFMPKKLMDFRPDHNNKTFNCPRTWGFLNKLIKGKKFSVTQDSKGNDVYEIDGKTPLYTGVITPGTAVEFVQFTKIFTQLPSLKAILADPENLPIPHDTNLRFAIVTFLTDHVTLENFEEISKYLKRFTTEFRVLFFRSLMVQKPTLREHPAFRSSMLDITRYLHDDANTLGQSA